MSRENKKETVEFMQVHNKAQGDMVTDTVAI